MDNLILFDESILNNNLKKRSGETKFGEHVQILTNVCNIYEQLMDLDVEFVIFGIPEDVGVFANYGKTGTARAWEATLKVLLNLQSNTFVPAKKTLILGEINCSNEMETLNSLNQNKKSDIKKARELVSKIDSKVTFVIHQIIKANKIPIIIGGGQNNAYGIIKGTALAKSKAINAINFDKKADFRDEEGRHSGNGFSYAYAEGFLKKYFIFGLHEALVSDKVFKTMKKIKSISFCTFESIHITKDLKFKMAMQQALDHIDSNHFGIEIDCGAIQDISSSDTSSSGFSVQNSRSFVTYFGGQENACYLHISEASPQKKNPDKVGNLLAYLITDFIKAKTTLKNK